MVSNRRGPKNNCGCCAPPCTCLVAKDSFRFTLTTLSVSSSSISIADACNTGNSLSGSLSATSSINYDDGFCGDSVGAALCPAVQSYRFGPVSIVVGDTVSVTRPTWVVGRQGSCLNPNNQCSIIDADPERPTFCSGFNIYGQVPSYYEPAAIAGAGISYFCRGGNSGTPSYNVYVSASYKIYGWDGGVTNQYGYPVAPTGWTRSGALGGNLLYTRNDNRATLSLNRVFTWYPIFFCNGTFYEAQSWWQLSAFTIEAHDIPTVALDYPFDPGGIFAGITGSVT